MILWHRQNTPIRRIEKSLIMQFSENMTAHRKLILLLVLLPSQQFLIYQCESEATNVISNYMASTILKGLWSGVD